MDEHEQAMGALAGFQPVLLLMENLANIRFILDETIKQPDIQAGCVSDAIFRKEIGI